MSLIRGSLSYQSVFENDILNDFKRKKLDVLKAPLGHTLFSERSAHEAGSFKNESFWRKKNSTHNGFHMVLEVVTWKMFSSHFDRALIEICMFPVRHK